jgi:hypothetical protein
MEGDENWKGRTLLIGGVLGALTGLGAAYLVVRRWETSAGRPRLSAGEGLRLGVLVLGMLRQIGQLGDGDQS